MKIKHILAVIPVTIALIASGGWAAYRWLMRRDEAFQAADILYDLLSEKVGTISQVTVVGQTVTAEYVCADIHRVFDLARWTKIVEVIQNAAVVDTNLIRIVIRGQQRALLAQMDVSPAGMLALSVARQSGNDRKLVQELVSKGS